MKRIRKALAKVAEALALNHDLLARAQHRYRANHKRAFKALKQKEAARGAADQLRADGHPARAARKDKKALRLEAVEIKNRQRKLFWLGRIKVLQQRTHKLDVRHDQIEAELKQWQKTHGVQIHGNHATGGTLGQRWVAVFLRMAANCAKGIRRNVYSMVGGEDIDHEIKPGPAPGCRTDCSSTVTGGAKSAGAPDPNGGGYTPGETMYTKTLMSESAGWREVSLSQLEAHGWGYIIYVMSWSDRTGHHTESFVGHGRTIGHGSPPVDFGVPDLFGDGLFRCYIHD